MAALEKLVDKSSFLIDGYLKGEYILPIIRRIIDPVLSINVAVFLYERYFHKFSWIDISDYKSMLNFIFKGEFIIPVTLVLVVHFFILFIIQTPFSLLNHHLLKKLLNYLSHNESLGQSYNQYRAFFTNKGLIKTVSKMNKLTTDTEKHLLFVVKAVFISLFYFIVLPEYNWQLFLLMMLFLFFNCIIIWFCHLLFSFFPLIFNKIKEEGEKKENTGTT